MGPGRQGCGGSLAWATGAFSPQGTQLFYTQSRSAVCGLGTARRAWTGGGRTEISREARPEVLRPGGRSGDTR